MDSLRFVDKDGGARFDMGKCLQNFDGVFPERDLLLQDGEINAGEQGQAIEINAIHSDIEPPALFDPGQKLLADRMVRLA